MLVREQQRPHSAASPSASLVQRSIIVAVVTCVAAVHTFFALVTPIGAPLPFGAVAAFRPNDNLGVFAYGAPPASPKHGCIVTTRFKFGFRS